jgi:hypothetical protein
MRKECKIENGGDQEQARTTGNARAIATERGRVNNIRVCVSRAKPRGWGGGKART